MATSETSGSSSATPDGRALRWVGHNQRRRAELVEAALKAIRSHGHGVGMESIARVAGTRKPAIYRHFGDRVGLYSAVAAAVSASIDAHLRAAVNSGGTLRSVLYSLTDGYLALAERDPEVYRFVVSPPQVAGSVAELEVQGITDRATGVVAQLLTERTGHRGARIWAPAIVGAVQASADAWLGEAQHRPRGEVVNELVDLMWGGVRTIDEQQSPPHPDGAPIPDPADEEMS